MDENIMKHHETYRIHAVFGVLKLESSGTDSQIVLTASPVSHFCPLSYLGRKKKNFAQRLVGAWESQDYGQARSVQLQKQNWSNPSSLDMFWPVKMYKQ